MTYAYNNEELDKNYTFELKQIILDKADIIKLKNRNKPIDIFVKDLKLTVVKSLLLKAWDMFLVIINLLD